MDFMKFFFILSVIESQIIFFVESAMLPSEYGNAVK